MTNDEKCEKCGYTHLFKEVCVTAKRKVCLGSALPPVHPQHLKVMTDFDNWQLVDLYVDHPQVLKMDATQLQYPDNFLEHIYASHLLEHLSHRDIPSILKHWYTKLKPGGLLTLNVPDLAWAARQILKYENGQLLDSSVYTDFFGKAGLNNVIYGTHEHAGEYHKAGFTQSSLREILEMAQFTEIVVDCIYDGHDMGVLFATALK